MPAKKKSDKSASGKFSKSGKFAKEDESAPLSALETAADTLRKSGIVATFSQNSRTIHRNVRDINVSNLSVLFHGAPIVEEAELSLNYGNRYGLIGRNGCGKSTLMRVIGARCFPIPDGIDIFHLKEEIEASDMTAKEAVMSVDVERSKLEKEAEELNDLMGEEGVEDADEILDRLTQIYERLEELDATTAEVRASKILSGLGFTPQKQMKKTREFSGGWRMRISLARALFIQPTLLLLDEPTNHLDMEAVIWLEDYLSKWTKILFLVSHSQDFLNSVCTHMVNFTKKKLNYYSGNYDMFVQTRAELEEEQSKRYKWEQDQIKQMKEYVAKFGHGTAKNAKQAQSKEKVLDKMVRGGLTDKVETEKALDFKFLEPGKLAPPVLQCNDVSFGYPGCEILYSGVSFGIDLDSRIALVGPNGAGKSTLLKVITGELLPLTGSIRPHAHLKFAKFTQHFVDVLDLDKTPLDYFMSLWPDMTREDCRKFLGRYGISGAVQTQIMGHLSDGQKSRVVLAKIANENPHLLLLDEPTNHLDMESIDSLARAINNFSGGLLLVSHDMRLISQVAKEIWMVDNHTVARYQGEISDFKMRIRKQLQRSNLIDADVAGSRYSVTPSSSLPVAPVAKAPIGIAPMAPPPPPTNETTEDAIRRSRLELAEIAIQKQRQRQASGSADPTPAEAAAGGGGGGGVLEKQKQGGMKKKDEVGKEQEKEKEKSQIAKESTSVIKEVDSEEVRKEEEKERLKAKKKAEKEAQTAQLAREEEERKQRREEKLRDMEEAKKMKEEMARLKAEKQKELEEEKAKRRAEEEAEAAIQAKAIEEKKREKEKRRAEREALRRQAEKERRARQDAEARQDPWTQPQQDALETALLDYPAFLVTDKLERWTKIAEAVSEKSKNQCLARYRLLKNIIIANKQSADPSAVSVSVNAV
mmetsp:Transcript_21797/g.21960  ORF Transcript_21797/g.21960 Transcript_21797/m.21960 type:complete len:927 (+) Transcript_21797:62-2842(+)